MMDITNVIDVFVVVRVKGLQMNQDIEVEKNEKKQKSNFFPMNDKTI